jgi:hypothetical protein
MNPARWSVRRIAGRWHVFPPYPTDQSATYPTWAAAYAAADRLARGIS